MFWVPEAQNVFVQSVYLYAALERKVLNRFFTKTRTRHINLVITIDALGIQHALARAVCEAAGRILADESKQGRMPSRG